jgi:hypothetical protein
MTTREELEKIIATRVGKGCEQFSKLINGKVSESSYKTEWLKLDNQALDAIEKLVEREKDLAKIEAFKGFIVGENLITNQQGYEKCMKAYFGWDAHSGFEDRKGLIGRFKEAFEIKGEQA